MGLDKKYRTPVRSDVFREISQRGTGKKNTRNTATSFVGFGVPDDTFILKKKTHASILTNYKTLIKQIAFYDPLEELFAEGTFGEPPSKEGEDYHELEMEVEEDPGESMHVNNRKRKMMESAMDRDMKRPNVGFSDVHYPEAAVQWYNYWSQKLKKGFLTDVPKEFTTMQKPPSLNDFMQTKTGDAIVKYSRFMSKQFI